MSKHAKAQLLETLRGSLSSRPYTYGDEIAGADDCTEIAFAISLWLLVLRDLSYTYGFERNFSDANLLRLADRLAGCDFIQFCNELKSCKMQLRLVSPYQGITSFKAVKTFLEEPLVLLRSTLAPFVNAFAKTLRGDLFRDINTICCFCERLTLAGHETLADEAADEYWQLESDMLSWHYDPRIVSQLRDIVSDWFDGFSLEPLDPHYSNGATLEVRKGAGEAHKRLIMQATILAEEDPVFSVETAIEGSRRPEQPFKPTPVGVLVPKTATGKRLVCPEPVVHAYWQQAVAKQLDRWFRRNRRMCIDLHDQDRTRRLCLRASGEGGYSTVDLSSASDTVTVSLVKALFADQPGLLAVMLACRSERVELQGRVCEIEKFAPMGSALCFPIECIVFSAVCALACDNAGVPRRYFVYGDDMIVPDEVVTELFRLLKALHFKVNEDKSYGPYSQFLEACGMEAWCGTDVTPLRLSRKISFSHFGCKKHPHTLKRVMKLCNKLYGYGLFYTRKALLAYLLEFYPEAPFAVSDDRGLYHPDPANLHLLQGYNPGLGYALVLTERYEAKQEKGPDDIRYQMVLERYARTDRKALMWPDDRIDVKCGGTSAHLVKRWVPVLSLRLPSF